jgi:hypothetical protein
METIRVWIYDPLYGLRAGLEFDGSNMIEILDHYYRAGYTIRVA